jgi:hypothetical protein
LRTHYNSNVEEALARTAQLLRDESIALEEYAAEAYRQSISIVDEGKESGRRRILISSTALRDHSVAIQRRVMRRVLMEHTSANGKTSMFKQVEALVALTEASNGCGVASLPGGATARLWNGVITICVSSGVTTRESMRVCPSALPQGLDDGVGEDEVRGSRSGTVLEETRRSHDDRCLPRNALGAVADDTVPARNCKLTGLDYARVRGDDAQIDIGRRETPLPLSNHELCFVDRHGARLHRTAAHGRKSHVCATVVRGEKGAYFLAS